jgi:hypothetical protein
MYQWLEITKETIIICTFITHETAAITYESKDNPMMPLRYRKVVSLFLTLSESRDFTSIDGESPSSGTIATRMNQGNGNC